jgi:rhamnosyltransferase
MFNKISICIPTYNAGNNWRLTLESIKDQNLEIENKAIIDSQSKDDTVKIAKEYGFEVIYISPANFDHGLARQKLAELFPNTNITVFLTQDAILATTNSIQNLVTSFNNPDVGLAYGRQLPHKNAKPLEIHLRQFNYPEKSNIRSFEDKDTLGFKVFFCSNSFAAYRKSALREVGGFPEGSIMGEDAIVSAKMLSRGYKIAYVSEAKAYHSHSYTLKEEFKRYFDTRIFHEQNKWLIEQYGKPTGEGFKFVVSELKFSLKRFPLSVIHSIASIFAKWLGYNVAKFYKKIPIKLIKRLSMHSYYWK